MDPRSVASPGLVSAFMQKKRHDLLRDHDQMGKHDCYWRAKVRKTTWVPDRDLGLCLREFLPPINIRRERQQTGSELAIAGRPQMAEGKAFRGAGQAQSVGKEAFEKVVKRR